MIIVVFSYCLDGSMYVDLKKALQRSEDIQYISSDQGALKYRISLSAHLPKTFEDLRDAEAIIRTDDVHIKRTFDNIMSAANAEISAIEDPLFLTLKDNLLIIQKTTILDPESTEFEMMFFYLKNYVIELMMRLLEEQFDLNKISVDVY